MHIDIFSSSELAQHPISREQSPAPGLRYHKRERVRCGQTGMSPIHLGGPADFRRRERFNP